MALIPWMVIGLLCSASLAAEPSGTAPTSPAAACATPHKYVKMINTGQYDAIGGLFTPAAVYMGPDGKTRHGAKAIGEFYAHLLPALKPHLKAISYTESGNQCFMELANKSKKTGTYSLTAIDHFFINADGRIAKFIVYVRPGTESTRELTGALKRLH
ncbi:MAG: nuclear transport factor 2 family protein [Candidatus Binataceae bacterium]